MPPANTTSASPSSMSVAPTITAFIPLPQSIFTLYPGFSTGMPAYMLTCLPGPIPCPAVSIQPTIVSSKSSTGIDDCAIAALADIAPSCDAGTSFKEPKNVPIAVLFAPKIYTIHHTSKAERYVQTMFKIKISTASN